MLLHKKKKCHPLFWVTHKVQSLKCYQNLDPFKMSHFHTINLINQVIIISSWSSWIISRIYFHLNKINKFQRRSQKMKWRCLRLLCLRLEPIQNSLVINHNSIWPIFHYWCQIRKIILISGSGKIIKNVWIKMF